MKMEGNNTARTKNKTSYNLLKFVICLSILFLILILFNVESSPFNSPSAPISPSWNFFQHWAKNDGAASHSDQSNVSKTMAAKLRDSVTFLPLKDLRFSKTYCFEKAVVMRHDLGSMGAANKLKVFDLMRCKAREFCSLNPGRGKDVNERGTPIIRLTLLMRRGSRSFKNATVVTDIFAKECVRVEGCILRVAQSEDLSFCDQVKVMTYTDILASPHGAQLTNMLFMDCGSSVMEFFPKGWLEHAGIGQYAHHWMANQSGMKHQGAWWDANGEECPLPKDDSWLCNIIAGPHLRENLNM